MTILISSFLSILFMRFIKVLDARQLVEIFFNSGKQVGVFNCQFIQGTVVKTKLWGPSLSAANKTRDPFTFVLDRMKTSN